MARSLATLRTTYYALGGGLGHGVRTLAFDRAWRRLTRGPRRWLVNTPLIESLTTLANHDPLGDPPELVALSPSASPAEAREWIATELAAHPPDVLIVDAFPRGLGGELVEPFSRWSSTSGRRPLRVLIARTLPGEYVARYRLVEAASQSFDLILAPGEPSAFVDQLTAVRHVVRTPAFLLRDAEELPTRDEAARRLDVSPSLGAILIVGAGTTSECDELADAARGVLEARPAYRERLRLALPEGGATSGVSGVPSVRAAPLIELLPAAAAVIGNAGYNLVHEAQALGVAGCWRTRPRKYDDQAARAASGGAIFATADDLVRWLTVHEALRPPAGRASYVNGATLAAAALAALVERTT